MLAALTLQPAGLANSLLPTRSSPPAFLADRGCTRLLTQHTAPSSLQRTLFCTVLAHGVHVAALVHDSTFRHDRVGLCSAPMAMPRRRGGTHLHCIVCLCWPAAWHDARSRNALCACEHGISAHILLVHDAMPSAMAFAREIPRTFACARTSPSHSSAAASTGAQRAARQAWLGGQHHSRRPDQRAVATACRHC